MKKKILIISAAIIVLCVGAVGYMVSQQKNKAAPQLDEADGSVSAPSSNSQPGVLAVTTAPSDAEVYIGNQLYQNTSAVSLKPGQYIVKVFKEGHRPYFRKVSIESGKNTVLNAVLESEAGEIPPEGAPEGE